MNHVTAHLSVPRLLLEKETKHDFGLQVLKETCFRVRVSSG
jgi:hypothetical protein